MRTSCFSYQRPRSPQPVLLLSLKSTSISKDEIIRQIQGFSKVDDVFNSSFLTNTLLIYSPRGSSFVKKGALRSKLNRSQPVLGKPWELNVILPVMSMKAGQDVPSGPYFLYGSDIYQAWKLCPDQFSCFQTTVLPGRGSEYS